MQAARTGGRRHAGRRANSATRVPVTTKVSSARHGQRANQEHAAQGNTTPHNTARGNNTPHNTEIKQSTKRAIPHILFIRKPPPKVALLNITSSFISIFFAFNPAGGRAPRPGRLNTQAGPSGCDGKETRPRPGLPRALHREHRTSRGE